MTPEGRPAQVGHQPKEYIMDLDRLYEVSVANLGPMRIGAYPDFRRRMMEVAQEKALTNPLMVIDLVHKERSEFGVTEQPYPISKSEWDLFAEQAQTMLKKIPDAHVVDRDKFTIPI